MKYDDRHGGPNDRGSADFYYGREKKPHYWTEGTGRGLMIDESDMTEEEIKAYNAGYDEETETKY